MTDENLNLLISSLSTPCWDLCDKTRLEIFDMAKELKWRRSAEKEYAVTSTPLSDKNPAGAICEPLKELFAAREKLKSLPEPCTKFDNASIKEWIAKLNEEVGEVVEALYEVQEPLKELIKLRAENKKINEEYQRLEHELDTVKDARPIPCKKFRDASKKEWVAKLSEEAGEVIEALYNPTVSREDCLREMVDVATVARSMAYATGYTLDEWEEMQRWVNGNNRQRGYMDEPVR